MKLIAFVAGLLLIFFLVQQRSDKREAERAARTAFVRDSIRQAWAADSMRRAALADSFRQARVPRDQRHLLPSSGDFTGASDAPDNSAAKIAADLRRKEACRAREARMEPKPVVSRCD